MVRRRYLLQKCVRSSVRMGEGLGAEGRVRMQFWGEDS